MARKKGGGHGGHGWFVTFADLMALLMSFFVMVAAFSSMDKQKLQIVAGSMREAFGTQTKFANAGIVEVDGVPTKPALKYVRPAPPEDGSDITSPTKPSNEKVETPLDASRNRQFALAAATLRQALQDLPDISEMSKNVIMEETPEGLNIQIVDQEGRAMFPENSRDPYDRTRRLLAAMAPVFRQLPQRIQVTGYTAATRVPARPGYGPWDLSADRANTVRAILEAEGVRTERFFAVLGKGDSEPLFPDDPYLAANRRVSILLMKEAPPLPNGVMQ